MNRIATKLVTLNVVANVITFSDQLTGKIPVAFFAEDNTGNLVAGGTLAGGVVALTGFTIPERAQIVGSMYQAAEYFILISGFSLPPIAGKGQTIEYDPALNLVKVYLYVA